MLFFDWPKYSEGSIYLCLLIFKFPALFIVKEQWPAIDAVNSSKEL